MLVGCRLVLSRFALFAKKYLGEKGIDASRISTRVGTPSTAKGLEKGNRRVDFIFVPEGATYSFCFLGAGEASLAPGRNQESFNRALRTQFRGARLFSGSGCM